MKAALATITRGLDDLADVDVARLSTDELCDGILAIQTRMDRGRSIQAHWFAEADKREPWKAAGYRDKESWLAAKAKTSVGTAKKQAALADALSSSPQLADALAAGEITPDTAEALQPTLASNHSGDVSELIDSCKGATPLEARQAGSKFREMNPPAGQTDAERDHETRQRRYLRFRDNGDGTKQIDGLLPTADAATVEKALKAIAGMQYTPDDDRTFDQRLADALVQLCAAYASGEVKGGRRNLPTILVTIDINDLNGNTDGPGYTSTGDVIPAEAVRRMCTNANIARILLNGSIVLDMGRRARLATDDQWRAAAARDGGCRMNGCNIPPEWCQVDHIHDWTPQQGPTDIDLLVLWCVYHHHVRHRPGVKLIGDANNLSIQYPDGHIVPLPARGPTTKLTTTTQSAQTAQPEQGDLFGDPAA